MSDGVRRATIEDWDDFSSMWVEYIKHMLDHGGDILPTERTMSMFRGIFDSYVTGAVPGVALIVSGKGVLLWGAVSEEPVMDTKYDPVAIGWGTYVRPENRGEGISSSLRKMAKSEMESLGFNIVMGFTTHENKLGTQVSSHHGFNPVASQVILLVGEEA